MLVDCELIRMIADGAVKIGEVFIDRFKNVYEYMEDEVGEKALFMLDRGKYVEPGYTMFTDNTFTKVTGKDRLKLLEIFEEERVNKNVDVTLIAGKLNNGKTLYWKISDKLTSTASVRDYAIVENAKGYALVKIVGIINTYKDLASNLSFTNYEKMKNVIKIIEREEIEHEDTKDN